MKMKKILTFLVFILALLLSSCCFECKKCLLVVKYAWKVPIKMVYIINMQNDSLILSKIFFRSDPNMVGNTQHVYDDKNYVINKENGMVLDTLPGFVPENTENKYLHNVGKNTKKNGILFQTTTSQLTISEDYKGYKIVLQEWNKSIRSSNNTVYNVMIYNGKRLKSKDCLPDIYDFTYDKTSLYIISIHEVYKFDFDELIK